MAQTQTQQGESQVAACQVCGNMNHYEELFVAEAHGPEYACRGCVAEYLSRGEWQG